MRNNYDDIINLSRPVSKRPRMTLEQRSAQFAPFAALTGYEGQVKETARRTDRRIELEEEEKVKLDLKIQVIEECKEAKPEVEITYFVPDQLKSGGKYETINGCIRKIDKQNSKIILENGDKIDIYDILDIRSEIFKGIIFE